MSKPNKNRDRREILEQKRKEARSAERRRTLAVVAVCVAVALVITGAAIFTVVKNNREQSQLARQDLTKIGAAAQAAGCGAIQETDASGQGQHTDQPVTYQVNPPPFGPHNPVADAAGKHFYTADERPALEILVHNEEHGWTIVWYDDKVAGDNQQLKLLKATAAKFDAFGNDPRYNVIIAPWTSADGAGQAIPDGKHIAFTHWSIHQPTYDTKTFKADPSWGESQYCTGFSGAALDTFMKKFPFDDAPEGYLWHR